ncbi:MAG: uracil-DNA glycosylase [Pseudomonadota bacterium]|nr:uracil-DNA glycosylase [Pseudomonadota bacterium]
MCPRLADFLDRTKAAHPDYHARPVAPFGDPQARLLIVGLAPGLHGANRTGRPFTGDHAGILLFRTLHRFGFANRGVSISRDDDLTLLDCRITNTVKCLPPQNKPEPAEVKRCNRYLRDEIAGLAADSAILALGGIAHRAVLLAMEIKTSSRPFAHGAMHRLPGRPLLFDSYHCSRYNTQTRRLTEFMFEAVFASIARYLRD